MNLLVATKSCDSRAQGNQHYGEDTVVLIDFGRCIATGPAPSCPAQMCEFTRSHIGTTREVALFDTGPEGVVRYTCLQLRDPLQGGRMGSNGLALPAHMAT